MSVVTSRGRWLGVLGALATIVIAACGLYGENTLDIELPPKSDAAADDGGSSPLAPIAPVDPVRCTTPGERCVPPAPEGWQGPFSLYRGNPSNAPTCAGIAPTTVVDANEGLVKDPFGCEPCGCTPPTGIQCPQGTSTIQGFTEHGCAGNAAALPCGTLFFGASVCTRVETESCPGSVRAKSFQFGHPGPPTGGACAAPTGGAPQGKDGFHFTTKIVGCGVESAPPKDCEGGQLCAPVARVPFESRLCVVKSADESCPGAPYSRKETVAHRGVANTRACSACQCALNPGVCRGAYTHHDNVDTTCSGAGTSALFDATICNETESPGPPYQLKYTIASVGAACSVGGGVASGDVAPTDVVTICCEP